MVAVVESRHGRVPPAAGGGESRKGKRGLRRPGGIIPPEPP
ncbi:hypothetical protein NY78_3487 [Desulfovibrio sp. TomC]|nr:hypothetical protein NY78_3487 [Desulfovibrio sp. TomC]